MDHTQARANVDRAAPVDVRTLLVEDHARLKELFAELSVAFRTGDRDRCAALWNALDSKLESHMTLEEQLILPEFAKVDSVAAAALAREHVAIRTSLSELGVGVDLHWTNAEAVERFTQMLEDHAKREDALMYRWAGANLPESVQTRLRTELGAAVRKVLGRK